MKQWFRIQVWTLVVLAGLGVGVLFLIRGSGVGAHATPGWIETRAARFMRSWLTPADYKRRLNPVTLSPGVLVSAREHFADHCATCHGNDGKGQTDVGRSLYPPAPDMTAARTQNLTDGELFYFIEHGVRLTGMPGWSTGTAEGETASWHLVHFIRHLPRITLEELQEMEAFNPLSRSAFEEEQKLDEFLSGGNVSPSAPAEHKHPQ
jgi:mono/diheme cytochrome c family protein